MPWRTGGRRDDARHPAGADRRAANPYVDVVVPTGMGEARNVLVVLCADAPVAVGGEFGTLSEIAVGASEREAGGRPRHLGAAAPGSRGRRDRARDQPRTGRRPGHRARCGRTRQHGLITTGRATLDYGRADGRGRRAHWPAAASAVVPHAPDAPRHHPPRPLIGAAIATAVLLGVALRFVTTSDLWLDEALTVNVARLPLGDIAGALRHDGAPPLYYYLLHGWIQLFGESDFAVRSLSAVFGVATLPVMWVAARRLGGRAVAWTAVVLLATSPFAIRYGTEARMYTLVTLLTLVGYLALVAVLESPTPWRLVGLAAVTGALLLTHYWAFYLCIATAVPLLVLARRGRNAHSARLALLAMAAGSLLLRRPGYRPSSARPVTRARRGPTPRPSRPWSTRSASSRAAWATRAGRWRC